MAYLQTIKRQRMDPNIFKPSNLTFTDVTLNEKGFFHVDLEDRRMMLGKTAEMTLSELHVNMLDIHNIKGNTRFVKTRQWAGSNPPPSIPKPIDLRKPQFMFAPSYTVKTAFDSKERVTTTYLPDCKIATLGELCHVLSYILSHKHIELRVENNKCVLHFTSDCDEELIDFDVATVRMLGLCKSDGTPPLILETMYGAELKWSSTKVQQADGSKKITRISLLRKKGKKDLSIELPYTANRVVWNYISEESPQFMFASTELVRTQFTGTKMTQTLAVVPINPLKAKLDYEPYSADWKRVEPSPINRFSIQFHDTRGVGFANLKVSFVLQFRTAQLI